MNVRRRGCEVREQREGFVSHGLSPVVEDGDESRDAEGGGKDALFGSFGPGREDGGQQLQRVEPGVKVRGLEEVEQQGDVLLALGELVGEPQDDLVRGLGAVLVGVEEHQQRLQDDLDGVDVVAVLGQAPDQAPEGAGRDRGRVVLGEAPEALDGGPAVLEQRGRAEAAAEDRDGLAHRLLGRRARYREHGGRAVGSVSRSMGLGSHWDRGSGGWLLMMGGFETGLNARASRLTASRQGSSATGQGSGVQQKENGQGSRRCRFTLYVQRKKLAGQAPSRSTRPASLSQIPRHKTVLINKTTNSAASYCSILLREQTVVLFSESIDNSMVARSLLLRSSPWRAAASPSPLLPTVVAARASSSSTSAIAYKALRRRQAPLPVSEAPPRWSAQAAVSNILYETPSPSMAPPKRHVLNCLVQNEPGVLSRVSGILAARGFNIDSLVVCSTEVADLSRMTIVLTGQDGVVEQARRQLEDLVPVWAVLDYTSAALVQRELLLAKINILGPEYFQELWAHHREITAEVEESGPGHATAEGGEGSAADRTPTLSETAEDFHPSRLAPSEALRLKHEHLRSITYFTHQFGGKVLDISNSSCIVEVYVSCRSPCDALAIY